MALFKELKNINKRRALTIAIVAVLLLLSAVFTGGLYSKFASEIETPNDVALNIKGAEEVPLPVYITGKHIYNGLEQEASIDDWDYGQGGSKDFFDYRSDKATEAGDHKAYFKPKSGYRWPESAGGGAAEKEFTWIIEKNEKVAIEVDHKEVGLVYGNTESVEVIAYCSNPDISLSKDYPPQLSCTSTAVESSATYFEEANSVGKYKIALNQTESADEVAQLNVSFPESNNYKKSAFTIVVRLSTIHISGQLTVNNTNSNRTITAPGQTVTFNSLETQETNIFEDVLNFFTGNQPETKITGVYSATVQNDGTYMIKDIPYGVHGELKTSIIGCRPVGATRGPTVQERHDARIIDISSLEAPIDGQDFNLEGPNLDYYTMDELEIVANDIGLKKQSGGGVANSIYNNEFFGQDSNSYVKNFNAVWCSNSNGNQSLTSDGTFTGFMPDKANENYKCSFTGSGATDTNQYLLLRVIGQVQDAYAPGGATTQYVSGLTLQCIHALPMQSSFGNGTSWWGTSGCALYSALQDGGSLYSKVSSNITSKIQSVSKWTMQGRAAGTNKLIDNNKMFVLGHNEMAQKNSAASWANTEGNLYPWYSNQEIDGSNNNSKLYSMARCNDGLCYFEKGSASWLRTPSSGHADNFLTIDDDDNYTGALNISFNAGYNISCTPAFCIGKDRGVPSAEYQVTVNPDGGSVTSVPAGWTASGTNYVKNVPKDTTYESIANDWKNHLVKKDNKFIGFGSGSVTDNITLTAQWETVPTSDFTFETFTSDQGKTELRLTGYTGDSATPTVPATAYDTLVSGDPLPVTEIASNVTGLKSVTNLQFGSVSKIRKIADYAFSDAESWTEVTLPYGIEQIGEHAFDGTPYITGLTDKIYYDKSGRYVLGHNSTTFDLTDVVLNNITYCIADGAFRDCEDIKTVDFGSSLGYVGIEAFKNCTAFDNINLPVNCVVKWIGREAFAGTYYVDTTKASDAIVKDLSSKYIISSHSNLPTKEERLLLNDSINTVGEYALQNNSSIRYVVVENKDFNLNDHAFAGCSALTSVVFASEDNRDFNISGNPFAGITDANRHAPFVIAGNKKIYDFGRNNGITSYIFNKCEGDSLPSMNVPHHYYYLNKDFNVEGMTVVAADSALDLNGKKINQTKRHTETATVNSPCLQIRTEHFRIDDTSTCNNFANDLGQITGGDNGSSVPYGGGISMENPTNNGVVVLDFVNGRVTGNTAQNEGAGIDMRATYKAGTSSATLNMYHGRIDHNTSVNLAGTTGVNGGGIKMMMRCTVNMYDGSIDSNKAGAGAGVFMEGSSATYGAASAFNMYGGTVLDNKFIDNVTGGIFVNGGEFNAAGIPVDHYVLEGQTNLKYKKNGDSLTLIGVKDGYTIGDHFKVPDTDVFPSTYYDDDLGEVVTSDVRYPVVAIGNGTQALPSGFAGMKELELGSNVTAINDNAFNGFTNLETVTYNNKVQYIGANAFNGCTNYDNVKFPPSVKDIETNALAGTKYMTHAETAGNYIVDKSHNHILGVKDGFDVELLTLDETEDGKKVESVASEAFENQTCIKRVFVSDSNNTIGLASSAFKGCSNLETFLLRRNPDESTTYCNNHAFDGAGSTTAGHVPFVAAGDQNIKNAADTAGNKGYLYNEKSSPDTAIGLTLEEGNYYRLTDNYKLNATCTVEGRAVLDLNGHNLDRGLTERSAVAGGDVIYCKEADFRLDDTSENDEVGSVTGGYNAQVTISDYEKLAGGICFGYIKNTSSHIFEFVNGNITGNYTKNEGGGISLRTSDTNNSLSTTLNIYRGKITGNTCEKQGGGIKQMYRTNVNMYGGEISFNHSMSFGGAIFGEGVSGKGKSVINKIRGVIKNNTSDSAGDPESKGGIFSKYDRDSFPEVYVNQDDHDVYIIESDPTGTNASLAAIPVLEISDSENVAKVKSVKGNGEDYAMRIGTKFGKYDINGIKSNAFENDKHLKKIVIDPRTNFYIEENAFNGTENLENFVMRTTADNGFYHENAFNGAGSGATDSEKPRFVLAGGDGLKALNNIANTYTYEERSGNSSVTASIDLNEPGMYYYCTGDYTGASTFTNGVLFSIKSKNMVLDINGKMLNRNLTKDSTGITGGAVIFFNNSDNDINFARIDDSSTLNASYAGQIKGGKGDNSSCYGSGISVGVHSKPHNIRFYLVNGLVTGNFNTSEGAGVDMRASFQDMNYNTIGTMYGGKITNNTVTRGDDGGFAGCGVKVMYNATFIMRGGQVTNNVATTSLSGGTVNAGGFCVEGTATAGYNSGKVYFYKGVVTGNKHGNTLDNITRKDNGKFYIADDADMTWDDAAPNPDPWEPPPSFESFVSSIFNDSSDSSNN